MFPSVENHNRRGCFHPDLLESGVCLSTFKLWCQERALLSTQEVVNHNLSVIQSVHSTVRNSCPHPIFILTRLFVFSLGVKHQRPTGMCAGGGHTQKLTHRIKMMQIWSLPVVNPPSVMYHFMWFVVGRGMEANSQHEV